MPFARLTLSQTPSAADAQYLSTELTRLIADELAKQHELTSVLIETPISNRWTIGASLRHTAAHLEVCVTAGTNNEAQKRAFIAAAMALLRETIAQLDAATYVVIKEVAGSDWGYDGRTQADRARQRETDAAAVARQGVV
ncbi:4-oxalocrotonate tautomerase family protein [Burkholderia sp. 22PA0099]|uniref:tautomerase family protein n=1 Tax=Burkholderia sp. 22PA0099 TaxID=3237372 RepID=UPI0039C0A880